MRFKDDIFNLADEVAKTAAFAPERVAMMEPYRDGGAWRFHTYTYAQLSADAESIAAGLRARGIQEHTRTVFMAPPSYQSCAVGVALTRVGATFLWIDPSVGYRNVAERLARVEPEAFIGPPLAQAGRLAFGWTRRLLKRAIVVDGYFPGCIRFETLRRHPASAPAPPAVSPDDPSNVLYTTGSTGPAKPAMYLHRQFVNVYRTAHYSWRFDEDERVPIDMAAFPAFQFIALSAGGTVVVPPIDFIRDTPATTDGAPVVDVINAAGVRSLFASPALLERVADAAHARGTPMPTLERVIAGGAPIFAPLMRSLTAVMSDNGEVWSNYGATEALPTSEYGSSEALTQTHERAATGEGICVGRTFPGIEIDVVGPVGLDSSKRSDFHTLPQGTDGELIVRGPNISTAYFGDEESTRKNKLYDDDGTIWHRLGDVGHLDEVGRIWVAGRVNQCLHINDRWLLPIPLESLFDQHPLVRRSGLAARRTRSGATQAVICIEPAHTLSRDEHEALQRDLLEIAANNPLCQPLAGILLTEALPVDPRHNAKIERGKLADWASRQPTSRLIRINGSAS